MRERREKRERERANSCALNLRWFCTRINLYLADMTLVAAVGCQLLVEMNRSHQQLSPIRREDQWYSRLLPMETSKLGWTNWTDRRSEWLGWREKARFLIGVSIRDGRPSVPGLGRQRQGRLGNSQTESWGAIWLGAMSGRVWNWVLHQERCWRKDVVRFGKRNQDVSPESLPYRRKLRRGIG